MAMERKHNDPITFEIVEHLAVIAKKEDGWCKELNLVSWNGQQPPKFDIREWSPDHTKMWKGLTLFDYEMKRVCQAYIKYCNARTVSEGRNNRNAAAEAGLRAGEEAARAAAEEDMDTRFDPQGGSGASPQSADTAAHADPPQIAAAHERPEEPGQSGALQ